jgi:hypothetical protein
MAKLHVLALGDTTLETACVGKIIADAALRSTYLYGIGLLKTGERAAISVGEVTSKLLQVNSRGKG